MPRKTGGCAAGRRNPRPGFNEAAARCRGKPQPSERSSAGSPKASMRPRPDAAENRRRQRRQFSRPSRSFNEAAARCRGKPRGPAPATPAARCFNEAAARCRGKPHKRRSSHGSVPLASMRPRPDAAENRAARPAVRTPPRGFNEAAARCRGKPRRMRYFEPHVRAASMRPRPDAAENRGLAFAIVTIATLLQ